MHKKLVIVESPAKARTLSRILGNDYSLKASMGHVRDLPKSKLGVDVESNFEPSYVVPREKNKVVKELRAAAKEAPEIFLATDPDREGEAISWHLLSVIGKDGKPYRRVVFHEITDEAIGQAFKHPRAIDMQLVNAQQARRILDRLVGYKISPLLWRKVQKGLSAGRVQSVALKIIVDREREIEGFVPVEYWSIEAELAKPDIKPSFRAMLISLADGEKIEIHDKKAADELTSRLEKAAFEVDKIKVRKVNRQPAPPFITSTLQQEAWRRFHFTAEHTMSIAQQLYEGLPVGKEGGVGLITYMRTDSTRVARTAVAEARDFIAARYGKNYIPEHARSFARAVKGAQEAHEAIRPTRIGREPSLIKEHLTRDQFKIYDLIWKRMVASQMAAAVFDATTVDISARCSKPKCEYLLRATSSVNRFPGFIALYTEQKDQDEEEEKLATLPPLDKGDKLDLLQLFPEQHFTQPPPRFTEATLIKTLEQYGIGRPSTYAPILSTIQERRYVTKTGGSFRPTELGFIVNDLVARHFPDIVNVEFTARMEDELDEVAAENKDWVEVIKDFYGPFEKDLTTASETMAKVKIADEQTDELCPRCGKPIVIKSGRFGKFYACSGYPECKYTRSFQVKTGVKCPECGSELVEKVTKRKRTFYGCSAYPSCKFAVNAKPFSDPCPQCGGLMTLYRDKWVKCTKCGHKGSARTEQYAASR